MSEFDDLLDELQDRGLDPADIERIKKASAGSPLRKEKDAAEERAKAAETRTKELEAKVLAQTLQEVGVTADPSALKLPDDLDVADVAAVKAWAVEAKFVEPTPDVDDEELRSHERIANAGAGTQGTQAGVITPADIASWPADRWMRWAKEHPYEAEELRRGNEVRGVAV